MKNNWAYSCLGVAQGKELRYRRYQGLLDRDGFEAGRKRRASVRSQKRDLKLQQDDEKLRLDLERVASTYRKASYSVSLSEDRMRSRRRTQKSETLPFASTSTVLPAPVSQSGAMV